MVDGGRPAFSENALCTWPSDVVLGKFVGSLGTPMTLSALEPYEADENRQNRLMFCTKCLSGKIPGTRPSRFRAWIVSVSP